MKYFIAIIILVFLFMVILNGITPKLGLVDGQLRELKKSPNGVSSQTAYKDKYVEPLIAYKDSHDRILEIIRKEKGLLVTKDASYIHVIFSTRFGFRDDVEFYITDNYVHYRSQSRIGYSDMDENYKRYLRIKELYEKASE